MYSLELEKTRIEKLKNTTLALLLTVGLVYLGAQRFTPKLYDRTYEDLCSSASPTILFETLYDSGSEKQIKAELAELPIPVVNVLGRDGYKVVLVADREAVKKRYPSPADSYSVGAYMDSVKKEIVIDVPPGNFPHELAHAVDYVFERLSLSEYFLGQAVQYRLSNSKRTELTSMRNRFIDDLNKESADNIRGIWKDLISQVDKDLASLSRLQKVSTLPYPLKRSSILSDYPLSNSIGHVFVEGFINYYSTDTTTRARYKQNSPELYAAFDSFDAKLRKFC